MFPAWCLQSSSFVQKEEKRSSKSSLKWLIHYQLILYQAINGGSCIIVNTGVSWDPSWISPHVPFSVELSCSLSSISVCPERSASPFTFLSLSVHRGNREEAHSVQERKQVLEDAHLLSGAHWAPLSPLGLSSHLLNSSSCDGSNMFNPCVLLREVQVTCTYWRTKWRPLLKWKRRRTWASESPPSFKDCLSVNMDRQKAAFQRKRHSVCMFFMKRGERWGWRWGLTTATNTTNRTADFLSN